MKYSFRGINLHKQLGEEQAGEFVKKVQEHIGETVYEKIVAGKILQVYMVHDEIVIEETNKC